MKSTIVVLFFIVTTCTLSAQETIQTSNKADSSKATAPSVSDNFLGLHFLLTATGLNYERKLANRHTFSIQTQLAYSVAVSATKTYYSNGTSKSSSSAYFAVLPQVAVNYRFYYNLAKRVNRGKSIFGNSGNYFTVIATFGFKPIYSNYQNKFSFVTTVGPAWGLHRTYKKNVDINFSIGLGYGYNNSSGSYLAGIGNFTFGYVFLPKRRKAANEGLNK